MGVTGSVFPRSLCVAVPCGILAAMIEIATDRWGTFTYFRDEDSILKEDTAWTGFSFLVGFSIVFRTSQAHSRFWEGCTSMHAMRAEWFDACAALVCFCQHSKVDQELVMKFKNILVRLFSMLHAAA